MSTLSPDVALLARDTVQLAPWQSEDADGKPTYGANVAHRARVSSGAVRITDAQGQELVAVGLVRFTGRVAVSTKDRLTLPDGRVAPILRVADDPDELSRSATAAYFGEARA